MLSKLTQTQKLILALVIFALTGYVIYSSFFSTPSAPSVSPDETGAAVQAEGQDVIDLAAKLDSISIDPGIFTSTLFKSLKDFDVPISPELQGRPNPFEIIGIDK